MSTDRLEVKSEDSKAETLEQSAERLKTEGVDINKDLSVNANGEGISVSEPKTEMQTSEDRPEWLPEKFSNAEELAKAYGALEKEFSARPKEEAKPAEDNKAGEDKTYENETNKGLDKYYEEYAEKGELAETSYSELAKLGLDKTLVDSYIEGQNLISDTNTKQIQDIAGGKEEYTELVNWATDNLSDAEVKVFNDMVEGGDIETAKFAVQGLMAKAGANPKQASLFEGTSDAVSKDAFASVAQVTEAMNDPRYETDPAYRRMVEEKIGRSQVF
jgi:hypothetical protein